MQIKLRVRYRAKPAMVAHQESLQATHSPVRHSRDGWHTERRPPRSLGVEGEPQVIAGASTLNDPTNGPDQLPQSTSDSSLASFREDSSVVEKSLGLEHVLTEEVQVHPGVRIVMHTDPRSAGADRFRFLRMCLQELWNTKKLKTLHITSPLPQDGKSTIALNLATALAEKGKRKVLLIEADLHRPALTEQLCIQRRMGLADCLEGSLNPTRALLRLEPLGWYLLPAGEERSNPTELLQTDAFARVLQTLSSHFDWILIDSPPVIPLTDALSLAKQADATILVAREGRTSREAIEKAIAVLGRQRILGIILNAVDGLERMYSGYYGYGYSANNGLKSLGRSRAAKTAIAPPVFENDRRCPD